MESANNNLKILLVENNLSDGNEMETNLNQMGHKVIATLKQGAAAIAYLESNSPDLVIIDVELKGAIDGATVGQRFAEANIPIIFSSSSKNPCFFNQVKSLNPMGYLVKPIDKLTLEGCLNQSVHFANLKVVAFWALRNVMRRQKYYPLVADFF